MSAIQQKRHAQIIDAAISSLAEIGRRVGLSKSVVAYHFGDKETLINEVVTAIYDKGFEIVRPPIDAEKTAQGQIEAFIRHSIHFYHSYRPYVVALSRLRLHLSNTGKPNQVAVQRLHKELSDVAAIFEHGQISGEFRHFDAHIMARSLRQALDGVLIEMNHHPAIDIDSYADELVYMFYQATKKKR